MPVYSQPKQRPRSKQVGMNGAHVFPQSRHKNRLHTVHHAVFFVVAAVSVRDSRRPTHVM